MFRVSNAVGVGLLAFALSNCFSVSSFAAPPVEVYGSLPLLSDAQLSPDGKHLAVVAPINGAQGVAVFALDDPAAKPKIAAMSDASVESIFWANSDRLICTFYGNFRSRFQSLPHRFTRSVSVAMNAAPAIVLMNDKPVFQSYFSTESVLAKDLTDSNYVFMAEYETNGELNGDTSLITDDYFLNLFRVNVSTGASTILFHGNRQTSDYLVDGYGHILLTLEHSNDDLVEHIMAGTREVGSFSVRGGIEWSFEGITEDQSRLTVLTYGNQDTQGLYTYQIGGNGLGPALFSDPRFDVADVHRDSSTLLVDGVSFVDDVTRIKYFDSSKEHIRQRLEAALPGESVQLLSHDATKSKYAVYAQGPKDPGTYYIFDAATSRMDEFRRSYPRIAASDIADIRPYIYKSTDGLTIYSYLTVPPGKAAKNLPLIVFPHAVLDDRDEIRFDWWAQFMASRGYAVLQPNFRGSKGYGKTFRNAGFGEWAGKVQDDIGAGVKKLVDDGIADAKRVCIVGAGYGGYAALAGVTYHPDLYACAISYAGFSDLEKMRYHHVQIAGNQSTAVTQWDQYMGGSNVSEHEADASPLEHASQVRVPVLLVHSQGDVTVPVEQSEEEARALRSAGKAVEFVRLDGDDHYLQQEKARIQFLTEVEKFLNAHIGK